uniref:60S ribosomal protein L37 n=1 Tax=Sus scrofa TaxID=9823 RepID=A0A8D0X1E5_PIG
VAKGMSLLRRHQNRPHTLCHHCGSNAYYHLQKSTCGKRGYPLYVADSGKDSMRGQHLNPRGQLLRHPVHLKAFNKHTQ